MPASVKARVSGRLYHALLRDAKRIKEPVSEVGLCSLTVYPDGSIEVVFK